MNQGTACLNHIEIVHRLPGRVRIELAGLRGAKSLAAQLAGCISGLKGVKLVQANPYSGRLLIIYDRECYSEKEIINLARGCWQKVREVPDTTVSENRADVSGGQESSPGSKNEKNDSLLQDIVYVAKPLSGYAQQYEIPYRRQLNNTIMVTGVVGFLGIKKLIWGASPLAGSVCLFNIASAATLISGYPLLRRGLHTLTAGGPVSTDLVTGAVGLVTSVLRESVLGLLVTWMGNAASLVNAVVREEYKKLELNADNYFEEEIINKDMDEAAGCKHDVSKKGEAESDEAAVHTYPENISNTYLGLSALSGITSGDWHKSLSMILASNPGSAEMIAPMALAAGARMVLSEGIVLKRPRVLQTLAGVDTVLFNGMEVISTPARVGEIIPTGRAKPENIITVAAALAAGAEHPLAGLLAEVRPKEEKSYKVKITAVQKNGMRGTINGIRVELGDASFFSELPRNNRVELIIRKLTHLRQSPLYVFRNGRLIGIIGLVNEPHKNVRELINRLRSNGVTVIGVITGENAESVQPVLDKLGIGEFSAAGLSAGEEAHLVAGLRRQGRNVAVISNNPGSLAHLSGASVKMLFGPSCASGAADVLISEHNLEKVGTLFDISLRCHSKTRQNLALLQLGNNLGLCLGAFRWLTPVAAAMYNSGVTLALGLNTLPLLKRGRGLLRDFWPDRPRRQRMGHETGRQPGSDPEPAGNTVLTLVKKDSTELSNTTHTALIAGEKNIVNNWPVLTSQEIMLKLGTNQFSGLTEAEVKNRLLDLGYNKLAESKRPSLFKRFISQLNNFMVQALLGSTVVCLFLKEFNDAVAILAIVVANAIFGMLQEQKAESSLDALKQMTAPSARALREGKMLEIPAAELVPGDIVLLEQGDVVPADVRLLNVNRLEIEESSLTGESCPVVKKSNPLKQCGLVHECFNMAFMGTTVTRGRATAVVVATGMSTEMGGIASLLAGESSEETPLQRRLEVISRSVLKACLAASGIVMIAGIMRGQPPFAMFLTGVSLAVAAIPEGLPATVTVALAAGVRRLAGRNAIVRRLPGVETLGCASVICTDKTGTLTKNQLTVQHIYSEGQLWLVSGVGYNPEGAFFKEGKPVRHPLGDGLILTLTAGVLCSDARVITEKESVRRGACGTRHEASDGRWSVMGDPLEGALLVAGMKAGLQPDMLRRSFPRLAEIPFDSERGYMGVSCVSAEGRETVYFKGAPEKILAMCKGTWEKGFVAPLTKAKTDKIMEINENLSGQALRVIAVAYRQGGEVPGLALDEHENELIFLGLVGMRDPLRLEVRDAVEQCRRAGIKVAMITGDHHNTAQSIGRELGILEPGRSERVITGPELEKMSDGELIEAVGNTSVFARVLPRHKMRLVNAFKGRGDIVAMIGDGVNDAPAVKSADIGVAMGLSGTDVTRESSTIIITDDNFTTVVASIEQGRGIYDNIRKTVRYLLATNVGEVVLMSLTVISGMPLALLPIQLLFLNLLGDGFPAVALGLDKPAPDVMEQAPRSPNGRFFDRDFSNKILSRGVSIGVTGLGSYMWGLRNGGLPLARTVTLASLTMSQLLHALDCRWDRKVNGRAAGNKYLTGAVGLSALLLAGSIYLPAARSVFKTQALGLLDWAVVGLGAGLSAVLDRTLGGLLNVFRPGEREERQVVQTITAKELTAEAPGLDLKLMPASVR